MVRDDSVYFNIVKNNGIVQSWNLSMGKVADDRTGMTPELRAPREYPCPEARWGFEVSGLDRENTI